MEKDRKCKSCGSVKIIMVEYSLMSPQHYDGVSEFNCLDCGARYGRWSDLKLEENQVEGRYGNGSPVTIELNHPTHE